MSHRADPVRRCVPVAAPAHFLDPDVPRPEQGHLRDGLHRDVQLLHVRGEAGRLAAEVHHALREPVLHQHEAGGGQARQVDAGLRRPPRLAGDCGVVQRRDGRGAARDGTRAEGAAAALRLPRDDGRHHRLHRAARPVRRAAAGVRVGVLPDARGLRPGALGGPGRGAAHGEGRRGGDGKRGQGERREGDQASRRALRDRDADGGPLPGPRRAPPDHDQHPRARPLPHGPLRD
mmetsp:Transcript_66633/g.195501  ORF Transcript_66633/g.195501 Transcript_66633/m.195501 type:complete len:233 (+) Transcript_66633:4756-5454(+)